MREEPDEKPGKGSFLWADKTNSDTQYWVGEKIGYGTHAVVYEGARLSDLKPVALRITRPPKVETRGDDNQKKFQALVGCGQISSLAAPYHKLMSRTAGVPRMYGHWRHEYHDAQVMELGPSLDLFLSGRDLSNEMIASVFTQMVRE